MEIAYLRNLFDDNLFVDASFGKTKVKQLVPKDERTGDVINRDAARLNSYVEAALGAISEKYLRSMVITIQNVPEEGEEQVGLS